MNYWQVIAFGILTLPSCGSASADVLIAPAEARPAPSRQPSLSVGLERAAPTRDPDIKLVSPLESPQSINSPFELRVNFVAHGAAEIDPDSVRATYLNNPSVDLTSRLKQYVSAAGINIAQVEAPPSRHLIRINIKDKDNRSTSKVIDLLVNGR